MVHGGVRSWEQEALKIERKLAAHGLYRGPFPQVAARSAKY